MKKCRLTFAAMMFLAGVSSCKKGHLPETDKLLSPTTGTRTQFTLDSIYLYAKQTYLWNDALPDYAGFNPRGYTSASTDLQNSKQALYAISQYKINKDTSLPFEKGVLPGLPKYSFIAQSTAAGGSMATVDTEGNGNDFGISFAFAGERTYVRMVDEGSPAALAGIRRGDEVLLVNDLPASEEQLNAVLSNPSLNLKLQRTEQLPLVVSLQKTSYVSNPMMKAVVLNPGNTAVGYCAFSRFSRLANSKKGLDDAFDIFAASGISTLVLDLRYNGGGYVETAKYLANLIASSALNGKVMYAEHFNSQMQLGKAPILKNQLYFDQNHQPVYINGRRATYADVDFSVSGNTYTFQKEGNLQTLKKIYFIVSGETASASEMLINSLKPYFDVKLIGSQTYGKPVGFFGITIDKYQMYAASFLILNAKGTGDYFNGLPVDISSGDDVAHDFGDMQEQCLSAVFRDLMPGSVNRSVKAAIGAARVQRNPGPALLRNAEYRKNLPGMIKEELKLIKRE